MLKMTEDDYRSRFSLAEQFANDGNAIDAIEIFSELINYDYDDACGCLAIIYSNSIYGVVDYKKSLQWCNQSIDRFNSYSSKNVLAGLYFYGDGVEINTQKSFELYQEIPPDLLSDREWILARMYWKGDPIKKELNKALQHAKSSYSLGNIGALALLAAIYNEKRNFILRIYYQVRFVIEQTYYDRRKKKLFKDSHKHTLLDQQRTSL